MLPYRWLAATLFVALPAAAQDVPPPPAPYPSTPTADLSGPPDFEGALTDQDPVFPGRNTPVDTYTLPVRAGDEVTVTMSAQAFDTYLVVRAPGGPEWSNDDYGSTMVSQVTFTAVAGGTYTILATAFAETGRGDYQIRVRTARPTVLQTVSGRLDYQDAQLVKGEYVDVVTVRSPSRGPFFIELRPLGFAGYLRVTSPGGAQTRASMTTDPRAIRVGPFQAEAGAWTVDVTSAGEGEQVGAYDVVVFTLDDDE